MRLRSLLFMVLFAVSLTASAGTVILARQSDPAQMAFEAARKTEVVDRDIRGAIARYRDVASRHASNRAVAANALLRLAACYERLGQPEARVTYQRIVREFADQPAPLAAARARLGTPTAAARQIGSLTPRRVIADEPGVVADISPDGRFALQLGSGLRISPRELLLIKDFFTNQTRTLLAGSGSEFAVRPVFSPDSQHVAYTWLEGQAPGSQPAILSSLRIIGTAPGATPRTVVAPDPRGGRTVPLGWSPDGTLILAQVLSVADGVGPSLAWVSVATGAVNTVKRFEPWRGIQAPNWNSGPGPRLSPDGRSVAYSAVVREGAAERYIFVMDANGQNERAVVKTAGANTDPIWTPDGSHLLFVGDRSGRTDLFAVEVPVGATSPEPVRILTGFTGSPLAVSRSGDLLYARADADLYSSEFVAVRDPAGSRIVQTFKGQGGVWSKGNRLAFFRLGHQDVDLIIRSFETGEERTYLHAGISLQSPTWLHDDSGLIIHIDSAGDGDRPGGSYYRLDPNTGAFTRLFAKDTAEHQRSAGVVLSHDGKSFYTAVRRNAQSPWTGIVLVDLVTGAETPVVTFPGAGLSVDRPGLALSPDGSVIAISHWAEGSRTTSRILTVRTDGTNLRELHTFTGLHRTDVLRWTPDGQALLFVAISSAGDAGSWRMMRVPAAGGPAEFDGLDSTKFTSAVSLPPTVPWHISNFDVSPDGSHLIFGSRTARTYDVWTIDNITSVLYAR